MRFRVGVTTVVLLVAAVVAAAPASAGTPVSVDDGASRLPSGHCLLANSSYPFLDLVSPSGRLSVQVTLGQLDLSDDVSPSDAPGVGGQYAVFAHIPRKYPASSSLCMSTTGDLVFRDGSIVAWHTRTAGRAVGGYAAILDDGRLVVRTASGRNVWSSRTTRIFLPVGDTLGSGQNLYYGPVNPEATRLEMTRGGNLVLHYRNRVVWSSGTHVRGSQLIITKAGRGAVVAPTGHATWQSPAFGKYAILELGPKGNFAMTRTALDHCVAYPSVRDCNSV